MKRYLTLITFILLVVGLKSQDFSNNFRQISIDQGLPGQNVRRVFQDFNGIIWISVESVGLCRYDGHKFEVYNHNTAIPNSLSSNYVNAILEDSDSNLWIGTDKGLNKFIRYTNSFKTYFADGTRNGLKNDLIHTLFLDKSGILWIGTDEGLLYYDDSNDVFIQIDLKTEEQKISVQNIFEHSNGLFYLCTNKGLFEYDPKSNNIRHWLHTNNEEDGLVHQNVRCVTADADGNLWIGTQRGINFFDLDKEKFKVLEFNKEDKPVFENEGYNDIYNQNGRYLWFASYTNGIVIIDAKDYSYQRIFMDGKVEGSIKSNHILHIYKDRSNLLWISTKFEGLFIYDKQKEMFNLLPDKYKQFLDVKNLHILSYYSDTIKHYFWIGTKYYGLYGIDTATQTIKHYMHQFYDNNSISNNRVHEVFRDKKGQLWVGLRDGLDKLDEKTGHFYHYGASFVEDIKEDNHSNLWIGTTEGIFVVDEKERELVRFKHENAFFSNDALQITCILVDRSGNSWFSTRSNGLYCYHPDSRELIHFISNVNDSMSLHGDMVRPLAEDGNGLIWIGTKANGINIYDPHDETFRYLTLYDGLPTNFVLSIQKDLHNNFWFGTHNGLSFYDISKKTFTNYTSFHGLQGEIFELDVNGVFKDGYILFGGHNGINIFHPDSIKKFNPYKADSLIFTSVKIFNKEILRDFSGPQKIQLDYNENYLTIEFALINYVNPMKHQFFYRMKGISDNWFDLGNKNYVTFSGLPPGEYYLEVKGINEYGISSKKSISMDITIKSPVFEAWWFKAAVFILISLIVLIITRTRVSRTRSVQQYLENEIRERTEKLRKANEKLLERNQLIEKQKKEIELNKSELEEKVRERTKDLEAAKRKAEESDNLKSSFIANMSHEIRTPLNAILGFSSLISDAAKEKPELVFYQESIDSNAEILVKIIDDVLDISKIEAGQLVVSFKEVNLISLLTEVLNIYKQQLDKTRKHKIDLIFNNPLNENEELIINTDPHRLKQVLFNLVGNALKFTTKGYVEFGFEMGEYVLQFYVKDTGIGIGRDYFDAIFERFVKLENKEELYRGNGLGLPLSKSLVELLGGKLWVDSLLGHGSTFYFTLPNEKYVLKPKVQQKNIKTVKTKKVINPGKQILIVEDESSNYQFIKALLAQNNSATVWAHNGREAIEILISQSGRNISLILMDIKMPGMDGYKTFEKVRAYGIKIPIIAVTAYAQSEDKDKIINFGFSDYISKPVNKQVLLEIIRKHLK